MMGRTKNSLGIQDTGLDVVGFIGSVNECSLEGLSSRKVEF